jgi:flagellar P-ring protein precursor FlgI
MARIASVFAVLLAAVLTAAPAWADVVRVKDLGRFMATDEVALVGYGVVIGLAGTGDSPRNEVTQQALKNVLSRFGANVTVDQVRSRNVAAVMVTATFPQAGNPGDRFDVNVSSIGDARSLLGGSLLMTPMLAADRRAYALAQGAIVVGGYRFDADRNSEQKNHPTSGVVSGGGVVQQAAAIDPAAAAARLTFVLKNPDITTAERLADGVNAAVPGAFARVRDAKAIEIGAAPGGDLYRLLSRIENVTISPDAAARVVVNERSGTVVAGGGVQISSVVISQGDIKVSVKVENEASQPSDIGGFSPDVRSLVVSNTRIAVTEANRDAVVRFPNTTVADLVTGLSRVHVHTREMIAILQAMQAAGALHADIIVQ